MPVVVPGNDPLRGAAAGTARRRRRRARAVLARRGDAGAEEHLECRMLLAYDSMDLYWHGALSDGTRSTGTAEPARDQGGGNSAARRWELQADCLAGSWTGAATRSTEDAELPFLEPVTEADLAAALAAVAALGEDPLGGPADGAVEPPTWTPEDWSHGSSEQRQDWFFTGYSGGPEACDTFAVATADL